MLRSGIARNGLVEFPILLVAKVFEQHRSISGDGGGEGLVHVPGECVL